MHWTWLAIKRVSQRLVSKDVSCARNDGETGLGHRRQQGVVIKHLMGVNRGLVGIHTTGQEYERYAVLPCIGDDVNRIGNTGTNRRDQHAGRTRCVPDTFSHETRTVLMLRQVELYPGFVECVDERQDFPAGNTKSVTTTGFVKASGNELCGSGHGRVPGVVVPLG